MYKNLDRRSRTTWLVVAYIVTVIPVSLAVVQAPRYFFAGILIIGALMSVIFAPNLGAYLMVALLPLEAVLAQWVDGNALKAIGIGIVLIWLTRKVIVERSLRFRVSSQWVLAVCLFAVGVASPLWGREVGPDYLSALFSFVSLIVWYLMTLNIIATVQQMRQLIQVFVFSVTASAVLAVMQYLSNSYDLLYGRAGGGVIGVNEFAAVCVATLPLVLGLAVHTRSWPIKLAYILMIPMIVLAIFVSGSRTGLISLAAVTVGSLFLFRHRTRLLWIVLVIICVGIAYVLVGNLMQSRFLELEILGGREQLERWGLWQIAWNTIQTHPIVGIGLGNFRYLVNRLQYTTAGLSFRVTNQSVVHNSYLSIWVELGIVGLIIFISLLVGAIGKLVAVARRAAQSSAFWHTLCLSILIGFASFLIMAGAFNLERHKVLWLFLILADLATAVSVEVLSVRTVRGNNGHRST